MTRRPIVGLLGVAGARSDPELAQQHEGYLSQVGRRLATIADIVSGVPVTSAGEISAALTELDRAGVDGIAVVPLGEGLPAGCAGALRAAGAPLLVANVQPERAVDEDWSEYDLRFNQGAGAAQELAGQCLSAGAAYAVLTGDWISERFSSDFGDWARAAQTARGLAAELPAADLLGLAAATLLDEHHCVCSTSAMDWNRDAILLRPSPGCGAAAGPATTVAINRLRDGELRLVVGSGELLGFAEQPRIEQPHLLFAPDAGLEAFMDAWLELGSPSQFVLAAGRRHARWRRLAELLEIDYEEI